MDSKKYWDKKHKEYANKDWIDKPTIFARFAIRYFPKQGKLLELGAGQGQDSRFFASLGYKVSAADFSYTAFKLLREKSKKQGLEIETQNIDVSKGLNFPNESFDIVYSHLALHYFDDKTTKKVFNEIYRVLKKGGIFATLTNSMKDPEIKELEKIEDGYYKTPDIYKRYFTVEYMRDLTKSKLKPLVLDEKGETYKDKIKSLIRFIGKKI